MNGSEAKKFVRKAEEFYAANLWTILNPQNADDFVVIEPESGDILFG